MCLVIIFKYAGLLYILWINPCLFCSRLLSDGISPSSLHFIIQRLSSLVSSLPVVQFSSNSILIPFTSASGLKTGNGSYLHHPHLEDQFYTLGSPSLFTDISNFHSYGNTTFAGVIRSSFSALHRECQREPRFFLFHWSSSLLFPTVGVAVFITGVLFHSPFSLTTVRRDASDWGFTQIMPTTSSPLSSTSIPATPIAPLPVALTLVSENGSPSRFLHPSYSQLPSVIFASSNSSPSLMVIAITPVRRGRWTPAASVFLIIPFFVQSTMLCERTNASSFRSFTSLPSLSYHPRQLDQVLYRPSLPCFFTFRIS